MPTLYITHLSSNFSWNTPWPMFLVISKGLYLFWFSFFEDCFNWIFLTSNHNLPSCFNPWEFHLFLVNYFFMASFAFFIDVFAVFQLHCSSRLEYLYSSSELWGKFPVLVILSLLLGFLSIGVFQNWVQMVYTLWLHVSCHYTRIPLLITILFNYLADNWHNIIRILWLSD